MLFLDLEKSTRLSRYQSKKPLVTHLYSCLATRSLDFYMMLLPEGRTCLLLLLLLLLPLLLLLLSQLTVLGFLGGLKEKETHIYWAYIRYQTLALCQPLVFDLAGIGRGAYCNWVKLCVQGWRESVVGVGSCIWNRSPGPSHYITLKEFCTFVKWRLSHLDSLCFPASFSKKQNIRKTPRYGVPKLVHDILLFYLKLCDHPSLEASQNLVYHM